LKKREKRQKENIVKHFKLYSINGKGRCWGRRRLVQGGKRKVNPKKREPRKTAPK